MKSHPVSRSDMERSRVRHLNCRTTVSALALALGLTACASHQPSQPAAPSAADKSAMLMKIADETGGAGDPATAASIYREVHDLSPKDPVPLARLAAASMAMQDYRTAVDAYRAALVLDPTNDDYHRGLAVALLALGDAQGAMTEIRAALEKHGDDARLYNALGIAEDMAGHHDLAQDTYKHGLDITPGNAALRNNEAMSLAIAGDYAKAVQEFGAIAGPTAPARYQLNLALAYGLAGDDAHAAATARQVLDEASVQNNLAYYALLRGMDEAHRSAAILDAELHGTVQVAEASANTSADNASAVPAASSVAPVAAAVLPPPLPTEAPDAEDTADLPPLPVADLSAPPKHVAQLAPKPRPTPAAAAKPALPAPATGIAPTTAAATPASTVAAAKAPAVPSASATPTKTPAPTTSVATAPAAQPAMTKTAPATASAVAPSAPAPVAAAAPAPATTTAPAAHAANPAPASPVKNAQAPQTPVQEATPQSSIANPSAERLDEEIAVATSAAMPVLAADALAAFATGEATPALSDLATLPLPAHGVVERYTVQLGSFALAASAHHVADLFAAKGIVVAISQSSDADGRAWFVVRTGEFENLDDANNLLGAIRAMGIVEPVVIHHRIAVSALPAA